MTMHFDPPLPIREQFEQADTDHMLSDLVFDGIAVIGAVATLSLAINERVPRLLKPLVIAAGLGTTAVVHHFGTAEDIDFRHPIDLPKY